MSDLLLKSWTEFGWNFLLTRHGPLSEEEMKRSKFSEAQVVFIPRQADEGATVGEVCGKAGISEATFYVWRKKCAGLMPSEMRRLRQLEDENGRLKRIVADL